MNKKSVATRIKISRRGIILRRPSAIGHNRTRKPSALLRHKRKFTTLEGINIKLLKNYLTTAPCRG